MTHSREEYASKLRREGREKSVKGKRIKAVLNNEQGLISERRLIQELLLKLDPILIISPSNNVIYYKLTIDRESKEDSSDVKYKR